MFCITVAVGNLSWRLLFKTEETAEKAFAALDAALCETKYEQCHDDFDQRFVGTPTALLFEDLEKTKLAHVELKLHEARTHVMAMKAANTDPALRAGQPGMSPAILSPMGGNGARPFG